MEDVGGNLGGIIGDLMSKGQQPRVVYDNFDFPITPGQLTKDHQNTDNHWISQFITFDRIDSSGLDNRKPIGDLSEFDIFGYLMNDDLLGRERVTGAKKLRKGCDKSSERFDNMCEVAEYWHAKQAFLGVRFVCVINDVL